MRLFLVRLKVIRIRILPCTHYNKLFNIALMIFMRSTIYRQANKLTTRVTLIYLFQFSTNHNFMFYGGKKSIRIGKEKGVCSARKLRCDASLLLELRSLYPLDGMASGHRKEAQIATTNPLSPTSL